MSNPWKGVLIFGTTGLEPTAAIRRRLNGYSDCLESRNWHWPADDTSWQRVNSVSFHGEWNTSSAFVISNRASTRYGWKRICRPTESQSTLVRTLAAIGFN